MSGATSLELPVTERCAFCDYLRGHRPYTIVRRTHIAATLVTREQRGISHVLVVPIAHRPTLLELTEPEAAAVMHEVVLIAQAIDLADRRPGIAVWQNNGTSADQLIPHVHFHVAGTLPGGGTERGDVEELSLVETERIAERLRQYLPTSA